MEEKERKRLKVVILSWGQLCPRGYLVISGNIFGCYDLGDATGIYYAETRDTVKPPAVHRIAPTKHDASQNVTIATVEKPCSRV